MLVTQLAAKQSGYADVVYLDAKTDTYLEEVSSCNIFTVKGNKIKTPPLQVKALLQVQSHSLLPSLHSDNDTADAGVSVTRGEHLSLSDQSLQVCCHFLFRHCCMLECHTA